MKVRSFHFSKLNKVPEEMEISLSDALKQKGFVTAVQSENASKGFLQVTLFFDEGGQDNVICKVFKTGSLSGLDEQVKIASEGLRLIHATQSYAQGNVFTILYLKKIDKRLKNDKKK